MTHYRETNKRLLIRALVVAGLMLSLPQWVMAETIAEMLNAVRSTVSSEEDQKKITPPTEKELELAERLFRRLFVGESGPDLRHKWAELGFELTGTRSESVPMLVLREMGEGATQTDFVGKGFFVFAIGRDSKTVLQVPHSFHDPGTEDLALNLMANNNFRAAVWNTAPAGLPTHPTLLPELYEKPAKDYMLAFTRAQMTVESDSHVVQLHSFDQKKMYSTSGSHADIILSGYGEQPNQAIGWLGRCLKKKLDFKIRTFPYEVQEMGAGTNMAGATYNAIGELMQKEESQGFVHLGMSGIFREELRTYPQVQKALFSCLSRE